MKRSDEIQSPMKQYREQQRIMRETLNSPMKQYRQQQRIMREALDSPMKQYREQQRIMREALDSPMKQYREQQRIMREALDSPVKQYREQQRIMRETLNSPMKQYREQQRIMREALDSPMKQYWEQQRIMREALDSPMKQYREQQRIMREALNSPMKKYREHQRLVSNFISSSFINGYKGNSFSLNAGIAVFDSIAETAQKETSETSFNTQDDYDLSEVINYFIELYWECTYHLQNGYNVLTNNKYLSSIVNLISVVGSLCTIYSVFQGDDININIYNNYEESDVRVDKKGDNIDIYIEGKELPLVPKNEEDNTWLSGGDRT